MDEVEDAELAADEVDSMSNKAMKALIASAGLSHADCFEKDDLRARSREALKALAERAGDAPSASETATGARDPSSPRPRSSSPRPRSEWSRPLEVDDSPVSRLAVPALDTKLERSTFAPSVDVDELMCFVRGDCDIQELVLGAQTMENGYTVINTFLFCHTERGTRYAVATAHSQHAPGDPRQRLCQIAATNNTTGPSISDGLTQKQSELLLARVVHWAATRDSVVASHQACHAYLHGLYLGKQRWDNLVNLCVVECRRQKHGTPAWVAAASQVGESLESSGRYAAAGPVYEAIGAARDGIDAREASVGWMNAATAWRRAGEYDKGEACYVRALRFGDTLWGYLEVFYDHWKEADRSMTELSIVYSALLDKAKYKAEYRAPPLIMNGLKPLAPRFKKKEARQLLEKLSSLEDVADLRKTILSAKNDNFRFGSLIDVDSTLNPSSGKTVDVKDLAREVSRNSHNTSCDVHFLQCSACGKHGNKAGPDAVKACSRCKSVFYCDAECQRADWSAHKKACKMLTKARQGHTAGP